MIKTRTQLSCHQLDLRRFPVSHYYLGAIWGTCCVHFVKQNMFYSYVGPNMHFNVVSDRWRLVCRMCGALMVTGGQNNSTVQAKRQRRGEGEKGKQKPQQGVMKVNGHA